VDDSWLNSLPPLARDLASLGCPSSCFLVMFFGF
ncbi:hypothetical protein A2U01_0088333, partial [Trifolium medium]|nr:hypothetical protein [Trifolium medium]